MEERQAISKQPYIGHLNEEYRRQPGYREGSHVKDIKIDPLAEHVYDFFVPYGSSDEKERVTKEQPKLIEKADEIVGQLYHFVESP